MTAACSDLENMPSHELKELLDNGLELFSRRYLAQSHLKIPRGLLPKVSSYRDNYFSYLKDSVYKSNICYLLQLIDYQLYLYRLFRPSLSLENSFFYGQMVTIGIIAEAVVTAILIDPLIDTVGNDRSLGDVSEEYSRLSEKILRRNFSDNIKALETLEILPPAITEDFQQIRLEIRNLVHLQGWEGRLYESLKADRFTQTLNMFTGFLNKLNENIKVQHTVDDLRTLLEPSVVEGRTYSGEICEYKPDRGFGFIKAAAFPDNLYFHISNAEFKPSIRQRVSFIAEKGKKGMQAKQIRRTD